VIRGHPSFFSLSLRKYFSSGWTFLIPYLAAYLLYYVLKWPVNAAGGGQMAEVRVQWSAVPPLLHVYWILHAINAGLAAVALVSWWREQASKPALPDFNTEDTESTELEHKVQGTSAEISQKEAAVAKDAETAEVLITDAHESARKESSPFPPLPPGEQDAGTSLSLSLKIAPWLLLGLLFWIPGVYLEFPADPWMHYCRINEWSWLQTVGDHSYWAKSSYFLAYSLLGRIAPPTRQLFWLDFYYTGCCLLLCWQYYRLARAVGLGERASMLFVILQTVLFGNNIFGFYRYYGISSSIFAQFGAIALIRIAIEVASSKFQVPRLKFQGTDAEVSQHFLRFPAVSISRFAARFPLSAFASALALLALIAFNHPQGLGIAALGLGAVAFWRLIEWRRSMIWWLVAGTLALSVVAVLWFPRDPAIDQFFRPGGWLTAWYGFNVFAFTLPVGDRSLQIIGVIGLVNLAAALFLLRRNSLVGWLTVTPIIALSLPIIAIPFAGAIARHGGPSNIVTFQRMLFAIPCALAMVALLEEKFQVPRLKFQGTGTEIFQEQTKGTENLEVKEPLNTDSHESTRMAGAELGREEAQKGTKTVRHFFVGICAFLRPKNAAQSSSPSSSLPPARCPGLRFLRFPDVSIFRFAARFQPSAFSVVLLSFAALLVIPASRPGYNRLFNAVMIPPDDLAMRHVLKASGTLVIADASSGPQAIGDGDAPIFIKLRNILTTPGIGYVLGSTGKAWIPTATKRIGSPPSYTTSVALKNLRYVDPNQVRALPFWASNVLYTPFSNMAILSGHWRSDEVALVHSTQEELLKPSTQTTLERRPAQLWLEWSDSTNNRHYSGDGAGAPLQQIVEDRGDISSMNGFIVPRVNDSLILRPVLRTLDGNGWRVSVTVTGPDSFRRSFSVMHLSQDTGVDSRIYSDYQVKFVRPGQYAIELVGETVWPSQIYRVRYTLTVADAVSRRVGD